MNTLLVLALILNGVIGLQINEAQRIISLDRQGYIEVSTEIKIKTDEE